MKFENDRYEVTSFAEKSKINSNKQVEQQAKSQQLQTNSLQMPSISCNVKLLTGAYFQWVQ